MSQHDTHADAIERLTVNLEEHDRAIAGGYKAANWLLTGADDIRAALGHIAALQARCDSGAELREAAEQAKETLFAVTTAPRRSVTTGQLVAQYPPEWIRMTDDLTSAVDAAHDALSTALRASAAAQRATGTPPTTEGE